MGAQRAMGWAARHPVATLPLAPSTRVVAALIQARRRRVQRLVDRRFNRSRHNAERTPADFSARLRREVDLEAGATP